MIIRMNRLRYDKWRRSHHLFTIIILVRYVTGMHLVNSGLRKMVGERAVQAASDTHLLFFLDGFFQLGFYWSWVGLVELLTAFLLMGQRLSAIGALLCLFIASNVGMLGISIGLGHATPQLLLFCSAVLLLIWDSYKLRPLFSAVPLKDEDRQLPYPEAMTTWHLAGVFLFLLTIGSFILREIFTSDARVIQQATTGLFFITATVCYILTGQQRQHPALPGQKPIRK